MMGMRAGFTAAVILACLNGGAVVAAPNAVETAQKLLSYEEFTLGNGLRVVVHTDRKAPVVSVAVWYHVGSKDERPGLKGFAHLFEHLMFNGSEHFNDEWFRPMEEVGATDVNGTTWFDRTNYYQTVPTTALDRVLWMESDRMGHLLGAIDQKKLDEQRGVVLNEKRQGDNQPYGKMEYSVLNGLFPEGHPYRWATIGNEDDLNAATLTTVKEWFKSHYSPSNAVLVLAGDIDLKTAKPLAEKYFGDIPSVVSQPKFIAWVPRRLDNTRDVLRDQVPQIRLSRNWAVPGYRERDSTLLDLVAAIVGGGKTSRLYKALVYDKALATSASLNVETQEIASIATLEIDVRPGVDAQQAKQVATEVLDKFLREGPTKAELDRIKTVVRAGLFRSLEHVSGKAQTLASGAVFADDPGHFARTLNWIEGATVQDVRLAARQWLGQGWHEVDVYPAGKSVTTPGIDRRTGLPQVASTPDLHFPTLQEARLSNGVKVVLAERPGAPLVSVAALFDAGYAADPQDQPGLSNLTMNMLDEGARGKSALQLAADLESLGATFRTGNALDSSTVSLSVLGETLAPALKLMSDVIQYADFNNADLERLRRNQLAAIAQEKADPQGLALRLLPPALYGASHPYGKPFTGSGTEAALKAIKNQDLKRFSAQWLRPETMTIYASGGVSLATLMPLLEQSFGRWSVPTPRGVKPSLAVSSPRTTPQLILIDKPGAEQSVIFAGRLVTPGNAPDYFDQSIANDVLGGAFTSRVNMNLREDKHWSYGAFTFLVDARGPRPWLILAPVQTDKTVVSIQEILKEVKRFQGIKGPSSDEVKRQVQSNTRSLPGAFESVASLTGTMVSNAALGRPADFVTQLKKHYEAVTPQTAQTAAQTYFRTEDLLWIVVGDRAKIEGDLRRLNLGTFHIWNEEGEPLKP